MCNNQMTIGEFIVKITYQVFMQSVMYVLRQKPRLEAAKVLPRQRRFDASVSMPISYVTIFITLNFHPFIFFSL